MANLSFDSKVLIEQVRRIESQQSPDEAPEAAVNCGFRSRQFEDRLQQRAQYLVEQGQWQSAIEHAPGTWRTAIRLALIVAALLGGVATIAAISGNSTVNIYWLLIVLIGFNFLSITLWFAGIALTMERLTRGVLTTASGWLASLLGKRDSATGAADRAWMDAHLHGRTGKWRYSQLNHGLWLVYLTSGLLALVLALTVRQYDFVWGTTLLSDDAFVRLTDTLGTPLQSLGFAAPDTQQVLATRIGSALQPDADHHYRWAQFLIGALLLYGILPRVVLLLVSRALLRASQANYAPDYYLPYYIRLRQQLLPIHGDSVVVDADDAAPGQADSSAAPTHSALAMRPPDTLLWVGVELHERSHWPPAGVDSERVLGQVTDTATLESIVQHLQNNAVQSIAIAVNAERAPDRGLRRVVKTLRSNAQEAWLVLLEQGGANTISDARLEDWYHLAMTCDIAAGHIAQLSE